MSSSSEHAAQAAVKAQKPTRIVPVVPHALNSKSRLVQPRPASTETPQTKDMKENQAPVTASGPEAAQAQAPEAQKIGLDSGTSVDAPSRDAPQAGDPVNVVSASPESTVSPSATTSAPRNTIQLGSASAIPSHFRGGAGQELPPPFYPSHQRSNPPSVASNVSQQGSSLSNTVHFPPKPSTNNLVFGGFRESANSSPAHPGPPPQTTLPSHQWPGQAPQAPPPFAPGNHSYHMSEPHAVPMYMPPFVHNSGGFAYPRDFYNHAQSPFGQPRTFYPYNHRFQRKQDDHSTYHRYPPPAPRMHPNAPPLQHVRRPPDAGQEQLRPPFQHVPPAAGYPGMTVPPPQPPSNPIEVSAVRPGNDPNFRQGDGQAKLLGVDDSSNLLPYIRSQFGNRDFADYLIHLSHTSYMFPPVSLPSHAIIMSRCPKLRSLIAMQHGTSSERPTYPKVLNVPVSDKFLNSDAMLMKALARLYGDPLLDQPSLVAMTSSASAEGNSAEQMRLSLAYAAAGHFLEIDEIISCGLDVAGAALSWENVGQALAFSLEGGLSSNFAGSEGGSEDRTSTSSFDEAPVKVDSPASAPAYGFYSDRLLNRVIGFIVQQWPAEFEFSSSAPQIHEAPRLPAAAEPRRSRAESRFSHIRFGEMTLDNQGSADSATAKLSSVLVSLPFPVLKRVVENPTLGARVGGAKLAAALKAVVDERESRRQRAIGNKGSAAMPDAAVDERLWYNTRWAESLEQDTQHPLGVKLVRLFLSAGTPASSESATS